MKKRALKIIRQARKKVRRGYQKEDEHHRKVCIELGLRGIYYDQASVWDRMFNR